MKESHIMYGLNALQYLRGKSESCAESEAALWLTSAQLGQVFTLEGHHHILVMFVTSTANEPAHMVTTCQKNKAQLYENLTSCLS